MKFKIFITIALASLFALTTAVRRSHRLEVNHFNDGHAPNHWQYAPIRSYNTSTGDRTTLMRWIKQSNPIGGVNTTDFISSNGPRHLEKRVTPGVAACEASVNLKQCSLVSHWNDITKTNVMYLYNARCELIGGPTVPIDTSQAPYGFDSILPYVVVVLQWSPTGFPEFMYAGAYFGWSHGFYRGYLLDDVYSYIAYFAC